MNITSLLHCDTNNGTRVGMNCRRGEEVEMRSGIQCTNQHHYDITEKRDTDMMVLTCLKHSVGGGMCLNKNNREYKCTLK